jgi:DNA repair protein RadA/Sms
VIGWDAARLHMVLAVLEARCGVPLAGRDVYLNVAGGLKVQEPAADLAVAAALLSSLNDCPVPGQTVIFGEIGLSGEVRPVSQMESRLKEAAKLGFGTAIMPRRRQRSGERGETDIARREVSHLGELVAMFETGQARPSRSAKGAR